MKKLRLICGIVLVLLLIIFGGWQLKSDKPLSVAVIDKTVATTEYAEHQGLNWLLKAEKYVGDDGEPYAITDYYGYHPEKDKPVGKLPTSYEDTNLIYITDTYGVYEERKGRVKPKSLMVV